MNRRPVVVAPLVIALAACLDATGVGTEVAQITLSAHSDTVWTIGARTRIVATALHARGNAVPVAGAEWSSTRLDVATVEPGFALPVGEGSTVVRVVLAGVAAEFSLTVRDEVRFTVSRALAESFQWAIEDTLTTRGVVGMTASVLMGDGTSWSGSSGWSAPGEERMAPSMTFPVASVTESFVSAAALLLAQEGMLSLEDTIGHWLQPIDHVAPEIGLRLLMSQTSGLASFGSHPEWAPAIEQDLNRSWSPDELLARFMTPSLFVPGERYSSSATNMFLTGMIVREATGRPLSETLRSRLIEPLGLTHTVLPSRGSRERHAWTGVDRGRACIRRDDAL